MPYADNNQKAQPWKAAWEQQAKSGDQSIQQAKVNQITGFKEGEFIIIGGQAGSGARVIIDTDNLEKVNKHHG